MFESSVADCSTLADKPGFIAVGADDYSNGPVEDIQIANTNAKAATELGIKWHAVAASDGSSQMSADAFPGKYSYGETVIRDGHVYRLPQSMWPSGRWILFWNTETNWKRASCSTNLRDMQVGSNYECTITRSSGETYTITASFRENWGRYFPVSEAQGRNCDLNSDLSKPFMFESSTADCGSLADKPGFMAIGSQSGLDLKPVDGQLQVANSNSAATNEGSITWTVVNAANGQANPQTVTGGYGENLISTDNVYRMGQSKWPSGYHALFWASEDNWKRAKCNNKLKDMKVGTTYECEITRSTGQVYTITATFREEWGRYFPISTQQGWNCDLSRGTPWMFETSSNDCGDLMNKPGFMAVGTE
jgi:hypothetical protein